LGKVPPRGLIVFGWVSGRYKPLTRVQRGHQKKTCLRDTFRGGFTLKKNGDICVLEESRSLTLCLPAEKGQHPASGFLKRRESRRHRRGEKAEGGYLKRIEGKFHQGTSLSGAKKPKITKGVLPVSREYE